MKKKKLTENILFHKRVTKDLSFAFVTQIKNEELIQYKVTFLSNYKFSDPYQSPERFL